MLCRPSDPLAVLDHTHLRDVLEGLGLAAFAIDVLPDGFLRFATANARFEEMAKRERTVVAGSCPAELFSPPAGSEMETYCQRCIDTRCAVNWQWRLPLAGETQWWSTNLAPQADRTGHIVRLIGIVVDITGLKMHESARRASESRLEHALDSIRDGFALWDANDRLVLCNRHYKDFYPAVAHLLQPGASRRLIADEAVAAGQFRTNGKEFNLGRIGLQGDGSREGTREEWLSDGRCLLASEGPSPDGGTIALRTDTTDRIRTERIVRQSRATLNAMMDAVDELIAMVNSEGVLLAINRAGAQMLSSQPDRLIGQPLAGVLGCEPACSVTEMMNAVLGAGSRRREDMAWRDRILDVSVHPVMAEDGTPVAISIVARDVTEQRAADERAREHQQILAHCMRIATMGEMAAAIAHELSQPITAIIASCYACLAELAPDQTVGPEAVEAIEEARREAERAGAILNSVSAFVRRTPTERALVDINDLVRAALDLARSSSAGRSIVFELDLAHDLPWATVNAVEIEQVILNLLRNSIDALSDRNSGQPGASNNPRVTISTRVAEGGAVEVSIVDNGDGFSPETMTRAFAPFFSTKPGGMGMGLAICRTIIDSHGGGIWAEAAPDGGGRVAFRLPLKEACHVPG